MGLPTSAQLLHMCALHAHVPQAIYPLYRERAPRRSAETPRPSLFSAVAADEVLKRSVVNRKSCATRTPAPTWLAHPAQLGKLLCGRRTAAGEVAEAVHRDGQDPSSRCR
ncbi:hypothetical protein SNOG_07347 [Parastagonospora nodorum SN15]|uniref:Uncharacterized protein n=1 Tax=Phaeosphaeria nodorum (strain SN15 / ATCC MYA-4574 / FGSC 10173) TaxID=321614 RepID=Q0ULL7_PHANO|nr:hypothetical protein SNOG_07347 [Parastagonospora nodorum SN15]EAT84813.1 hypothetical protein SNOG_07347 [Parastagonospora nodorum SN15]